MPKPGGGSSPTVQQRAAESVLFGRATPKAAAENFVTELKGMITG